MISIRGDALSRENDLSTNLANLVQHWYFAIDRFNQVIFNGSDSSIQLIHDTISKGKVLEASYAVDILEAQTVTEKAIFGCMIPQAWFLNRNGQQGFWGDERIRPVVMFVPSSIFPTFFGWLSLATPNRHAELSILSKSILALTSETKILSVTTTISIICYPRRVVQDAMSPWRVSFVLQIYFWPCPVCLN